jgi:hypothetical protein
MRRPLRPLWVLLALLFLLEAWLWDHLKRLIAFVLGLLPLEPIKAALRNWIANLPPWAALGVFVVPFLVLLPLKFLEVYLLATKQWLAAILVLILAKLLGLGVTAFVFDATREKLLEMAWFRTVYEWFIWALYWAHRQVDPVKERVRRYLRLLRPDRAGRFFRLFTRIRRRMQGA